MFSEVHVATYCNILTVVHLLLELNSLSFIGGYFHYHSRSSYWYINDFFYFMRSFNSFVVNILFTRNIFAALQIVFQHEFLVNFHLRHLTCNKLKHLTRESVTALQFSIFGSRQAWQSLKKDWSALTKVSTKCWDYFFYRCEWYLYRLCRS